MPKTRAIRSTVLATALGAASLTVLAAAPAHADVVPSTCAYSFNLSVPRAAATCYDNTSVGWYLQVTCTYGSGRTLVVKGSISYSGPGTGVSIAQCPGNTELGLDGVHDL